MQMWNLKRDELDWWMSSEQCSKYDQGFRLASRTISDGTYQELILRLYRADRQAVLVLHEVLCDWERTTTLRHVSWPQEIEEDDYIDKWIEYVRSLVRLETSDEEIRKLMG